MTAPMIAPSVVKMIDPQVAEIIGAIQAVGGRCFIVGGFVRDWVRGVSAKDADVDVFGISFNDIIAAVASVVGADRVNTVGQRFGVVKVSGINIDISVPRIDNRCGAGHMGFACDFDPEMTIEMAAARRDFTMNAMSIDVVTGEIIDPFGGRSDIEAGIIRMTSEHFSEDIARPMRGFQFCSRMGFEMDAATVDACRPMAVDVATFCIEGMWAEWRKFFKGSHPSVGMRAMAASGWVTCWPEIAAQIGVDQDSVWHPEGDVWAHVMQVCDRAAEICDRDGVGGEDRVIVVAAAFCHDFGKPETTSVNAAGRIVSPGHAKVGAEIANRFMASIGAPAAVRVQVASIVAEHMIHADGKISSDGVGRFVRRMAASVANWARVVEADNAGRGSASVAFPAEAARIVEMAAAVNAVNGVPPAMVMGRHMIEIGWRPGPAMGAACRAAHEAQMSGAFSDVAGGVAWVQANFSQG